jgi:hypothetical protein
VPGALRALVPASLPEDLLHPVVRPPRYVWRRLLSWIGRRLRRRASAGKPAEHEKVERR